MIIKEIRYAGNSYRLKLPKELSCNFDDNWCTISTTFDNLEIVGCGDSLCSALDDFSENFHRQISTQVSKTLTEHVW